MLSSVAQAQLNVEVMGIVPEGTAVFPQWTGIPMSVMFLVGIAYAYKGHGSKGLTVLMIYIGALSAVQLTMKKVLHTFPYPLFMSVVHFIFTFIAVHVAIKVSGEKLPEADVKCPKFQSWFMRNIIPTGICQYLAVVMNNLSLIYIGAGINAMIGLATPVVTALVAAMFGLPIALFAWVGILFTVGGDGIITMSGFEIALAEGQSVHLFLWGVFLSVFAMGTRGAKTVLQDKLMNNYGDADHKNLTPLQSWSLMGPVLITLGLAGTLLKEGLAPYNALPGALASGLFLSIMANIASAVTLNISAVYTIKMLGAPAAQIAGKMNVLIVAALSCALLGETLTLKQGASTLLIIAGAMLFEKAQHHKINSGKALLLAFRGEKYDATAKV